MSKTDFYELIIRNISRLGAYFTYFIKDTS